MWHLLANRPRGFFCFRQSSTNIAPLSPSGCGLPFFPFRTLCEPAGHRNRTRPMTQGLKKFLPPSEQITISPFFEWHPLLSVTLFSLHHLIKFLDIRGDVNFFRVAPAALPLAELADLAFLFFLPDFLDMATNELATLVQSFQMVAAPNFFFF